MEYLRSRMRTALDDDADDDDDKAGEGEDGTVSDREAQARHSSFPLDLQRISMLRLLKPMSAGE